MATLDQLESALRAADAAGNVEDARALAQAYQAAKASAAPDAASNVTSSTGPDGVFRVEIPRAPDDGATPQTSTGRKVANALYKTANLLTPFGGMLNLAGSGDVQTDTTNAVAGLTRGAGSIGATALAPIDYGMDLGLGDRKQGESRNTERRRQMDEALASLGADTGSTLYGAGKIGAEIAGTAGVGGLLANGVRGVAAAVPTIGRFAAPIAAGLESAGMSTGMAPGLANTAVRIGTGAVVGGASSGLVDPHDAGTGALIGGSLPPALQLVGKAGDFVGRTINAGRRAFGGGQQARDAASILQAGDIKPAQFEEVRAALGQQGPNIVDAPRTAPQILQNPGISQLGRSLRNAGDTSLLSAEQLQDAARMDALRRVAPIGTSPVDAAGDFGTHFRPQVTAADEAARLNIENAFDNARRLAQESGAAVQLPLDEMRAAQGKFLGRGTFGTGGRVADALRTAEDIGTEVLPGVAPVKVPIRQGEDLFSAMKALGGLRADSPGGKAFSGELYDLKQSGARSVIRNGGGQSPDKLAEAMHARGFIADDDPATLLNAMREHAAGNKVFAVSSERRGAMRAGLEMAQGDAPGAERIAKAVPFDEVQNLRSSVTEAWDAARSKGANKEAAALDKIRKAIDSKVDRAMSGDLVPGENFPADVVDEWRRGLALHAGRMNRFRNGPVGNVFNPAVDEGGLAAKFYSPRASQANDVKAFRGVADPESLALLKGYAVTGAADTKNAMGQLTNAGYNDFLRARSAANRGLFNEQELATLGGVGSSVREADTATRLGMGPSSNTAQNFQSALGLGLLDNKALSTVARRIPIVGNFTGPMLDILRESAKKGKVDRFGRLLANPDELAAAVARLQALQSAAPLSLAGPAGLAPMIGRTVPVLATGQ